MCKHSHLSSAIVCYQWYVNFFCQSFHTKFETICKDYKMYSILKNRSKHEYFLSCAPKFGFYVGVFHASKLLWTIEI